MRNEDRQDQRGQSMPMSEACLWTEWHDSKLTMITHLQIEKCMCLWQTAGIAYIDVSDGRLDSISV